MDNRGEILEDQKGPAESGWKSVEIQLLPQSTKQSRWSWSNQRKLVTTLLSWTLGFLLDQLASHALSTFEMSAALDLSVPFFLVATVCAMNIDFPSANTPRGLETNGLLIVLALWRTITMISVIVPILVQISA